MGHVIRSNLAKTTGYSRARLTRLIRQHRERAKVVDRRDGNQGRPFARVYTPADARLLAQVDADLGQMSGLATRVVLHREHHVFGDARFERLAGISASHIYNLRSPNASWCRCSKACSACSRSWSSASTPTTASRRGVQTPYAKLRSLSDAEA